MSISYGHLVYESEHNNKLTRAHIAQYLYLDIHAPQDSL